MRIDAYLSLWGVGTRKSIAQAIAKGNVLLDGLPCAKKNTPIHEGQIVQWYGETLSYRTTFSYVMHKKKGSVTGHEPGQPSVYDDLPQRAKAQGVKAVGRLDKDTTGLLFFTSDGKLLHQLTAPKYKIERRYLVVYEGTLPEQAEELLLAGFDFKEGRTAPVKLLRITPQKAELTLTEGRYHEVKRLMSALGCKVTDLHRSHYGDFALPKDLKPGEVMPLEVGFLEELFQRSILHERL